MTHPLIRDNISLLKQSSAIVKQLDSVHYGSVGPHFRHVIDHYALFLAGLSAGIIDYDQRQRDAESESCSNHLLARIDQTVGQLLDMDSNASTSVEVKCATCTALSCKEESSTIGRELMFLHSHAVHHLAIISLKLENAGVKVDPTVGLAPSTQCHYANLEGNLKAAS